MALTEFELIKKFFVRSPTLRTDVLLGIGDDAALLQPPADQLIVASIDTLVENIHFFETVDPFALGYKSLAVNLSDLAAMGATPAWALLSLTMPTVKENFLTNFARGFFSLLDRHHMTLVGGDTTKGPLSITVQVMGFVPPQKMLTRGSARPGDKIYVTGTLGDAALALAIAKGHLFSPVEVSDDEKIILNNRLIQPEARVNVGLALRGIATCAIDISDGLAADLGHILEHSKVGATLFLPHLPLSSVLRKLVPDKAYEFALTGGDDYELCFLISPEQDNKWKKIMDTRKDITAVEIGVIEAEEGLRFLKEDRNFFTTDKNGYQAF